MSALVPILKICDAAVSESQGYDSAMTGVSLEVKGGQIAVVQVAEHQSQTPLADVAMGLCELDAGTARFGEHAWSQMPAADVLSARSRIGRVFSGADWVSNLDLDENILLKLRHHRVNALEDAEREVTDLAGVFGVADILGKRPAWVSRSQRKRAQWVRALAGMPELLLLEHPDRDVDNAHMASLYDAVKHALQRSAAVVWVMTGRDTDLKDAFPDAQRFRILNQAWLTDTI